MARSRSALSGTAFLTFFSAASRIVLFVRSLSRRDSVAVYGTGPLARSAAADPRFLLAGTAFLKQAANHLILMEDDDASLRFYKAHEGELSRKVTCIGLQQTSPCRMQPLPNVFYFNLYEEVARSYWEAHSIPAAMKAPVRIVFLGCCRDNPGYSLLNLLFRKAPKITCHVFRDSETLFPMDTEGICWHTDAWQRHLDILLDADRILLCRPVDPFVLDELLLTCTTQQIHYYDPDAALYPQAYDYPHLQAFGCTKTILNERNFRLWTKKQPPPSSGCPGSGG